MRLRRLFDKWSNLSFLVLIEVSRKRRDGFSSQVGALFGFFIWRL
jgi:hypothetical protein